MQEQAEGKLQSVGCVVMADDGATVTLNPEWLDYLKVSSINKGMRHELIHAACVGTSESCFRNP